MGYLKALKIEAYIGQIGAKYHTVQPSLGQKLAALFGG